MKDGRIKEQLSLSEHLLRARNGAREKATSAILESCKEPSTKSVKHLLGARGLRRARSPFLQPPVSHFHG